jgi:Zn-dependent peptidase ImmA (M78 family)
MDGKQDVWEQVERFRNTYLAQKKDQLPVDVITLAEIELKLNLIPFPDLFEKFQADAALIQDFSAIYVDAESYILLEEAPIWKQYRLRFSLAHELGHYILHREIAERQKFQSFDQFFQWIRTCGGEKYTLEQAANEFAGRLLVPRQRLESHLSKLIENIEPVMRYWRTSAEMLHMFAESIHAMYGVNAVVIEVRLEREGLWIVDR